MLYTYALRYHEYSGNVSLESSFEEIFENSRNIYSVLFQQQLGELLEILNLKREQYLRSHSAMPYYRLFLKKETYRKICNRIFDGKSAYTRMLLSQQSTDSAVKSDKVYYCPECIKEKKSFESIQTYHQINGVHVCAKHRCYLKSIPVTSFKKIISIEKWDMDTEYCEEDSVLVHIAEDIEYIINNPPGFDTKVLRKQLFDEALIRGAFRFGQWQDEVQDNSWMAYYDKLPKEYEKFKDRVDFRRFADHHVSGGIDPIEYLLFIRSLFESFEKFVKLCFD